MSKIDQNIGSNTNIGYRFICPIAQTYSLSIQCENIDFCKVQAQLEIPERHILVVVSMDSWSRRRGVFIEGS